MIHKCFHIFMAQNKASLGQMKYNRSPFIVFVNIDFHLRILLIESTQPITLVFEKDVLKEAFPLFNVILDTIIKSNPVQLIGN